MCRRDAQQLIQNLCRLIDLVPVGATSFASLSMAGKYNHIWNMFVLCTPANLGCMVNQTYTVHVYWRVGGTMCWPVHVREPQWRVMYHSGKLEVVLCLANRTVWWTTSVLGWRTHHLTDCSRTPALQRTATPLAYRRKYLWLVDATFPPNRHLSARTG